MVYICSHSIYAATLIKGFNSPKRNMNDRNKFGGIIFNLWYTIEEEYINNKVSLYLSSVLGYIIYYNIIIIIYIIITFYIM